MFSTVSSLCICFLDLAPEPGAPVIVSDFKDCQVVAGSTMTLECKFSGTPQPEIQWVKDGGPLGESDRITWSVDGDVARLSITKTVPDDEGWYRCRVINEHGAVSTEAELVVVEAPKFVKSLEDILIGEGMNFSKLNVT